jgi:hypothetical protein
MTTVRRFVVLATWLFWQGGFTFYASVVVPIGTNYLRSALEQGFITRRVTFYLNLAGAAAVVTLAWDILTTQDPSAWRRRLRWLLWALVAGMLAALAWLHPQLDELMNPTTVTVREPPYFRGLHRWYLWISTVQWAAGLASLLLLLVAWRGADAVRASSPP